MSSELKPLLFAFGAIGYLTVLGLIMIAAYALWVGPELFGFTESWPLVSYFVVPYLGTLLVASGVAIAIQIVIQIRDEHKWRR